MQRWEQTWVQSILIYELGLPYFDKNESE